MAVKKPSFYHTLKKVEINEKRAAEILGVEVADVHDFCKNGAPIAYERLLLIWDKKHVGRHGWNGWLFSQDVLLFKGQRFRPESILRDRDFRNKLERDAFDIIKALKTKA
ncbi:hypothetical protein [Methylomonas sp. AM2-LC]|uniref:hypothetical protein n=1 Tax=Methylomonas sp. AM2-LC TaxID=3153301 RepID=UPI003263983B